MAIEYAGPELRLPHLEQLGEAQLEFLLAWDKYLYRGLFGGRQSGKTDIGIDDDLLNAMFRYPGEPGAIFPPDFPRSIEIRERIKKYVPRELREYNAGERIWKFKCPHNTEIVSPVIMRSLSEEDAPRSFTFRWAHFDEAREITEAAYRNALACMATTGEGDRPGPHTITTTHKGRGYLHTDFYARPTEDHWARSMQSIENPAFSRRYWDQLIKRHGFDSPWFKQEYRGLSSAFVGQAIPAFDRTKHVYPTEMITDWEQCRGWDFGWTAPTVAVWLQISPDEHVTVKGCKLWTETDRPDVLRSARFSGLNGRRSDFEAIDPAGAAPRAAEAGDRGWRDEMEDEPYMWDVQWTRQVGESKRLRLIRQWVQQGKFNVDPTGENAELVIEAFETGDLDNNPEKDRLRDDQHPQADILDAIGYPLAVKFGGQQEPEVYRI